MVSPRRTSATRETMAAVAESDFDVATRAAKLWPNREHESSAVLGLFCRLGIHRWRQLNLGDLMPKKKIAHCFWCSKVKVDGIVYDV